MESLCSKCNRAIDYSDMFRLTRCSFYKDLTTVRFNCNEFVEKSVDMSTDAEAQQAINLLLRKGYSIEQVQAAWRISDNNQQESVNA